MSSTITINTIDVEMGGLSETCSVYLLGKKEYALIETGTANSAPKGFEGLKKIPNFSPERVKYIIPTHIHLDHAGGTSYYLKRFPNAVVLSHPQTLKHLIDPEIIFSSTQRTDDLMAKIFGKPGKNDEEKVFPIKPKELISFDDMELEVVDAPGHHTAHYAFYEKESQSVFTGDSTGWYWKKYDTILPTTPPPRFDLTVYKQTIQKFISMKPKKLFFTHFGETTNVTRLLERLLESTDFWYDTVNKLRIENPNITVDEAVDYLIDNYYHSYKNFSKGFITMAFKVPIIGIWLYQDKEKNGKNHE